MPCSVLNKSRLTKKVVVEADLDEDIDLAQASSYNVQNTYIAYPAAASQYCDTCGDKVCSDGGRKQHVCDWSKQPRSRDILIVDSISSFFQQRAAFHEKIVSELEAGEIMGQSYSDSERELILERFRGRRYWAKKELQLTYLAFPLEYQEHVKKVDSF